MLNLLTMPKVVLEEKINLNSKNIWNAYNINNAILENKGQFIINHNLIDDTFDIIMKDVEEKKIFRDIPYVNINGENLVDGDNTYFYYSGNDGFMQYKDWNIKRSLLKNTKFYSIKSFVVGMNKWNLSDKIKLNNAYYWNFMFPKFTTKHNVIISDFNKIIDIKTIEQIIITNVPKKWRLSPNFIHQREKFIPQIEFKYNHIYLIPKKPNRFKTTNTFFDIYSKNESNNQIDYDFKILDGELKSSSFGAKKMTTYFEATKNAKKILNGYKFIGQIKTLNTSYYDYKNKKTKIGLGPLSSIGEQIPFNLKNDYFRNFKFGVNSIFKDLNILLKTNFKTPVLDSGSGQIRLLIKKDKNKDKDKDNNNKNTKTILSKDLIKFKNNDLSLTAIERISHKTIL